MYVHKVTGMRLKVPWKKVLRRVGVLLGNMFRLKFFWEHCHPGKHMKFLSIDQKPAWFNNAGHTGTFTKKGGSQPRIRENFAKTRERYSILTSVPSWQEAGGPMPKVAVLFKAAPDGPVHKELLKCSFLEDWVKVQVQENGSYRSEDVVEALDWMLPQVTDTEESIIVMLDWYSGHLTDEVQDLIRSKGHTVLYHGGGCTPFTQVNDTHLHAWLQRKLCELENVWMDNERKEMRAKGQTGIPEMKRDDIVNLVQSAWQMIDHHRVATTGYSQTGPGMKLEGPVRHEEVYPNLLEVLLALESKGSTDTCIGTKIRDDAKDFVEAFVRAGRGKTWKDRHLPIEEQDGPEEALAEGLEAYSFEATDYDDRADSDRDPEEIEPEELDAGGGEEEGNDGDKAGDSDDDVVLATMTGSGDGAAAAASTDAVRTTYEEKNAELIERSVRCLLDLARARGDNTMLSRMRAELRGAECAKKARCTDVAMALRKRSEEQMENDLKRRRKADEDARLSAKDAETQKARQAEQELLREQNKIEILKLEILKAREAEKSRTAKLKHKAQQRWLQTKFPVLLAQACIQWRQSRSPEEWNAFKRLVDSNINEGVCDRVQVIPWLWDNDTSLLENALESAKRMCCNTD